MNTDIHNQIMAIGETLAASINMLHSATDQVARLHESLDRTRVVPPPQEKPPPVRERPTRPRGLTAPTEAPIPRIGYEVEPDRWRSVGKDWHDVPAGRGLRECLAVAKLGSTVFVRGERLEGINQYRLNPGAWPNPIRENHNASDVLCVLGDPEQKKKPIIEGFAFQEIGGTAEFHIRNIEVQPDAYQIASKWEVSQICIGSTITARYGTLRLYDVDFRANPNAHYKTPGLACKWIMRLGSMGLEMRRIRVFDPAQEWFCYLEEPAFLTAITVSDETPDTTLDFGRGFFQQTSRRNMGTPESHQGIYLEQVHSRGTNDGAGGGGAFTFCYPGTVHLKDCTSAGGPTGDAPKDGAALVVWEMGGDGGPTRTDDGFATGDVLLENCMFSHMDSKRSLMECSGARSIQVIGGSFAGSKPWLDCPREGGERTGKLWIVNNEGLIVRSQGTQLAPDAYTQARSARGLSL